VAELLVLWDVDYTLVSADGLGTRLYEAVFLDMFGRELTAVAPKAGRTDRAIAADTLALAGVPAGVDAFLAALARAAADGAVSGSVRALPGAAEAIAALAAAGIRQSVLTGNIRPLAALKLGRAGLGDHLDLEAGAFGDAHEVRAELVAVARQAACRRYRADFSGASTVLVGDTPLDVEAALATGARVVAVATGSYPAAELTAAGADVVLPDLTDTAGVLAAVTGAGRAGAAGRAGQRSGDPGRVLPGKVPLDRAAGRARPGPPLPAVQAEHPGHLRGGCAGLLADVHPPVPQRLDAFGRRSVIPGLVLPLILRRVRQAPVKLHDHPVRLVQAIPASPPPVRSDEWHLPGRLGQAVGLLHVPVVAEFQHRMIPACRRGDKFVQVRAPAQPRALGHRLTQAGLVGKFPGDRAGHPAAHVVEVPRGLRQVKHGLLDPGPRRPGASQHGLGRPPRPVQADTADRHNVTLVRNRYVDRIARLVSKPVQFSGRPVAEHGARACGKYRCPELRAATRRPGERGVDPPVH
jgi:phosphoglycolate phosphatase